MDTAVFRWINGWPDGLSPFFEFLSSALNILWVKVVLLGLMVGMAIASPKTRWTVCLTILAVALANGLTDVLKAAFAFHRPYIDLSDVHLRVGKGSPFGTASAHSANMAATAFIFTAMLGRWGWAWIVIAFLVGLSRIYVGAHYPSQVLLGWLCGAFAGFLVISMYRIWTVRRNASEGPDREELPEHAG